MKTLATIAVLAATVFTGCSTTSYYKHDFGPKLHFSHKTLDPYQHLRRMVFAVSNPYDISVKCQVVCENTLVENGKQVVSRVKSIPPMSDGAFSVVVVSGGNYGCRLRRIK
jgi:hypothetical protein